MNRPGAYGIMLMMWLLGGCMSIFDSPFLLPQDVEFIACAVESSSGERADGVGIRVWFAGALPNDLDAYKQANPPDGSGTTEQSGCFAFPTTIQSRSEDLVCREFVFERYWIIELDDPANGAPQTVVLDASGQIVCNNYAFEEIGEPYCVIATHDHTVGTIEFPCQKDEG